MATENEREVFKTALLDALEGTPVSVVAGAIFHDSIIKPLDREGAQAIIDRLHARDFVVVRP